MELQEEEREVLLSIYECDPAFNQLSPITYQYKFGEEGDSKSFLMEICWGEDYPNEVPKINMNTFYNEHINDVSKEKVCTLVMEEAEKMVGTAMTYSLIELVKENYEDLIEESDTPDIDDDSYDESIEESDDDEDEPTSSHKNKKEHMTKAQKRRMWNRLDGHGEKARGWDWVDIIHHLAQTGPKPVTTEDVMEGS